MSSSPTADEGQVQAVAVRSLVEALRRLAAKQLAAPYGLDTAHARLVERLMRIAIAVAGAGPRAVPKVMIHNLPAGPDEPPQILPVSLPDLVAARASDHLVPAVGGDEAALEELVKTAERILATEDVQLD